MADNLPDCASDFGFSFHEIDFLENLFFAVTGKFFFVVAEIASLTLAIVEGGTFVLCVVIQLFFVDHSLFVCGMQLGFPLGL